MRRLLEPERKVDLVPWSGMSVTGGQGNVHVDPRVKRVLIYRLGSLGDTLVALPSLHLIARAFPNAERRMLTNFPVASRAAASAAVLENSGLVHSYEPYPVGLRSPFKLLQLILKLRWFRPDVIVYLKATPELSRVERDSRFLRTLGASRIIGIPETGDPRTLHEDAEGVREPEAQRLLRSLTTLGTASLFDRSHWDLCFNGAEIAKAKAVLAPLQGPGFFAVSLGTKVQSNEWGLRNWQNFLGVVAAQYPGWGLMLAGAQEERALCDEAASQWRSTAGAGPVLNTCGMLRPRESAAAFQQAAAFFGHDSGPMHLAAAVNTRVLGIFSARNKPGGWFPVCSRRAVVYHRVDCWGCELDTCVEQRKKCIFSITVQEALQALHSLMQDSIPNAGSEAA